MKLIFTLLIFTPLLSAAQQKNHRFENDTLYTSSGFKIYKGQTLQFGKMENVWIGYRYINIKNGISAGLIENKTVVVKDLWNYGYSPTGSATIHVKAYIVYNDGSKGVINFSLAFDLAIGKRLPGLSPELIIPKEFMITKEEAQAMQLPAFENDTLYTSSGYKIYKGLVLQFGKPSGSRGKFRYVNIKTDITHHSLQKRQVRVKELKEFGISILGNAYITIIGTLIVKNTDRMDIELHMAFDHALAYVAGLPGELIVPENAK